MVAGDLRLVDVLLVVLVDGGDASGMARMLADLLRENLAEFPGRARVVRRIRGDVVFAAADRGVSVTLSLGPERIEVRNRVVPEALMVSAPWLVMARLCSGQVSPLSALMGGGLGLAPGRHFLTTAAAGFVLSVPASHYGEARRVGISLVVAVTVVLAVALLVFV